MGHDVNWNQTWRVRVASGWGLMVLPYQVHNPTPWQFRHHGTLAALDVMGTWQWVSSDGTRLHFVSAFSQRELVALATTRIVDARIDTAGKLDVWKDQQP